MLGSKSKKKFGAFIAGIKRGDEDVSGLLGLKETYFESVPFLNILDNSCDIASGVTGIRASSGVIVLDMFDTAIIKEYDSGDVKYIFSTITSDSNKIEDFAEVLFREFGPGVYDDARYSSFHDEEKIRMLAQGEYRSPKDELVHIWIHTPWVVLLQYRIEPLREFSLFLTRKKIKEIDRSIRRKGTILDILTVDIREILQQQEESRLIEARENEIRFVDYRYGNFGRELGVFTAVNVRLFHGHKLFHEDVHTNVTFTVPRDISTRRKIEVMDKLIQVYGADDLGMKDIELHEIDLLDGHDYWTGRTWNFNEFHGLWNIEDCLEKFAYSVTLNYDSFEAGFTLSIIGYNNLVSLFSIR